MPKEQIIYQVRDVLDAIWISSMVFLTTRLGSISYLGVNYEITLKLSPKSDVLVFKHMNISYRI